MGRFARLRTLAASRKRQHRLQIEETDGAKTSAWCPLNSLDALLEFREQLLVCEPARDPGAWLVAGRNSKSDFMARLVRPHMRRCNRKANLNIIRRDVEHHEVL